MRTRTCSAASHHSALLAWILAIVVAFLACAHDATAADTSTAPPARTSPTVSTVAPTSGFVDENGKPVSQAEYDKVRERETQNILRRQPVGSALVILVLLGGIGFFVYRTKQG